MKTRTLTLLALFLFTIGVQATDVVVDRVVIKKHPIPAPYLVFMAMSSGHAKQSFHEPKKLYGGPGGLEAAKIEIHPKLVLKDVQINNWVTFTLQLDTKEATVSNVHALKTHTGRFQILAGHHDALFTPEIRNTPFVYQVFWHTE